MSLVEVGCAQSAQKAFDMAEAAKIGRHRAQCAAAGLDYCSLVVSVGGGLSGDFVSKVVQPYFKQERAAAKKEGRSTWEVQRRLDRYLDHLACASSHAPQRTPDPHRGVAERQHSAADSALVAASRRRVSIARAVLETRGVGESVWSLGAYSVWLVWACDWFA